MVSMEYDVGGDHFVELKEVLRRDQEAGVQIRVSMP